MDRIICYDTDNITKVNYLTQWDINRELHILKSDINITTDVPEVHFSNSNMCDAYVTSPTIVGDYLVIQVPNILLQEDLPISIYIYVWDGETSARTTYTIKMDVRPRQQPEGYIYDDNIAYIISIPQDGSVDNAKLSNELKETINGKLDKSGGTMTGLLNMGGNNLTNINALMLSTSKSGVVNFNNHTIVGVKIPTANVHPANKKYVDDENALDEKIANKVTVIDDTADNTKYPTALAVKNAVEAIPASPATRTRIVVAPEDIVDFKCNPGTGGTAEKPYFIEVEGIIPIGRIDDGVFIPTTNPAFLAVYDEANTEWIIDYNVNISDAMFSALYQGMTVTLVMDTIETFNNELDVENNNVTWHFEAKSYFEYWAEAEQTAEIIQQLISTGAVQNMKFIYETFVEKNLEFEE